MEYQSGEFVVHVKDEYDYRFQSDKRDEIFQVIKEAFLKIYGVELSIYGIPGSLKK